MTLLHTKGCFSDIMKKGNVADRAGRDQARSVCREISDIGGDSMLSKRLAEVDRARCVACGACAQECPKGAVRIMNGCFARIQEEICVGCGKCARICPAGCIEVKDREGRR